MEGGGIRRYLGTVILEFSRVLIGLTIAFFHVRVADFLCDQDQAFAMLLRQKGVPAPGALPKQVAHTLFFLLGIAVALYGLGRIWMSLHGTPLI
jgi:hypothetical protein